MTSKLNAGPAELDLTTRRVSDAVPASSSFVVALVPPRRTALSQRDLHLVYACTGRTDRSLVVDSKTRADRPAGCHELRAEQGGHVIRDQRVGGPPATTLDHDEVAVGRVLGWAVRCHVSSVWPNGGGVPAGRARSAVPGVIRLLRGRDAGADVKR